MEGWFEKIIDRVFPEYSTAITTFLLIAVGGTIMLYTVNKHKHEFKPFFKKKWASIVLLIIAGAVVSFLVHHFQRISPPTSQAPDVLMSSDTLLPPSSPTTVSTPTLSSSTTPTYTPPQSPYIEVTSTGAYVRNGPNIHRSAFSNLNKGDTAPYLGESSLDDRGVIWHKIQCDGREGWVSGQLSILHE